MHSKVVVIINRTEDELIWFGIFYSKKDTDAGFKKKILDLSLVFVSYFVLWISNLQKMIK